MFRKDDNALRQVVMDVLATMIADGGYQTILAKWGLAANAVTEPMLNAAAQ
jgi:polar amino acid transport system substrate-binding protein